MTLQYLSNICAQQVLLSRSHGLDEGPHEANVAAAMAATFGTRSMHNRLTGAEVGHGELAHVADDFAVREMQTGLSLTDQRGVGDHCERHGCARRILDVDDLSSGESDQ